MKDVWEVEWFPKELFKRLSVDDRKSLIEYRVFSGLVVGSRKRINHTLKSLKKQREEHRELKKTVTIVTGKVEHLKKDFDFGVYVVTYKKRERRYYNLCLKRSGKPTKNIYLGKEEVIRDHMSKYFDDPKYLNQRSDWISKMNHSGYQGDLKKNLLNLILDDPHGFDKRKLTLGNVLPLVEEDL